MAGYNTRPRFSAGALVMFSKKYPPGMPEFVYTFPEGDSGPSTNWYPEYKLSSERIAGTMPRGLPFMLVEDPKLVSFPVKILSRTKDKDKQVKRVWKTISEKRWKIRILHEQRFYHMYLTKKQYDGMLVKAVARRLLKDYDNEDSS